MVKTSWQTGKLRIDEELWIFQRTNYSIWCIGVIPPKFRMGLFSRSSQFEMKNFQTGTCGRRFGCQKCKQPQGLVRCGQNWSRMSKAAMVYRETKRSTMRESWEASLLLIRKEHVEFKEKLETTRRKVGMDIGSSYFLEGQEPQVQGNLWGMQSMHASSKLTSLRESVWKELLPKDHEDRIAGKGFNSLNHHTLVHNFYLLPQGMNILDTKASVDEEWEKLEKSQHGERPK